MHPLGAPSREVGRSGPSQGPCGLRHLPLRSTAGSSLTLLGPPGVLLGNLQRGLSLPPNPSPEITLLLLAQEPYADTLEPQKRTVKSE